MCTFFKLVVFSIIFQVCAAHGELPHAVGMVNDLDKVVDFTHPRTPEKEQLLLHARTVAGAVKDVRREILQNFLSENETEDILAIIEWGGGLGGVHSLFLLTQKNVFWWNWRVSDPHDRKTAFMPIPTAGPTLLSSDYIKKQFGNYAGQEGALFSSDRIVFFMTIYEGRKISNSFFCDFPDPKEKSYVNRSETFQQLVKTVNYLIDLFHKNGVLIRFWINRSSSL